MKKRSDNLSIVSALMIGILILAGVGYLSSNSRTTGQAFTFQTGQSVTIYNFLQGISSDPSGYKIVIPNDASNDLIQTISQWNGQQLHIPETVFEKDLTGNEQYLIHLTKNSSLTRTNKVVVKLEQSGNNIVFYITAKYDSQLVDAVRELQNYQIHSADINSQCILIDIPKYSFSDSANRVGGKYYSNENFNGYPSFIREDGKYLLWRTEYQRMIEGVPVHIGSGSPVYVSNVGPEDPWEGTYWGLQGWDGTINMVASTETTYSQCNLIIDIDNYVDTYNFNNDDVTIKNSVAEIKFLQPVTASGSGLSNIIRIGPDTIDVNIQAQPGFGNIPIRIKIYNAYLPQETCSNNNLAISLNGMQVYPSGSLTCDPLTFEIGGFY